MNKLVFAVALLGMVALAAAVDAEVQKKHYKKEHEEEEYKPEHHKGPVWKHVEFELDEKEIKTWPCDEEHEVLGSTVTYEASLQVKGKTVGEVYWSGIVVKNNVCPTACPHKTKINYEVTFVFTHEDYEGELVAGGLGDSVFSEAPTKLPILGGSGAFLGASGTITWTAGKPLNKYEIELFVPKHKHYEEYEKEKY